MDFAKTCVPATEKTGFGTVARNPPPSHEVRKSSETVGNHKDPRISMEMEAMTKSAFRDFKPSEAVARSLVPATFPQLPRNSSWWRCSIVRVSLRLGQRLGQHPNFEFWKQGKPPSPLFPQPSRNSPAAKLGFWHVVGSQSYIAKHVVFDDKHCSHDRTRGVVL